MRARRKKRRPTRRGPGRPIGESAAGRVGPSHRRLGDERCKPRLGLTSGFAPLAAAGWGLAPGRPRGVGLLRRTRRRPRASRSPRSSNVIHPQLRKIVRVVGQPSFVQSYERTSIYPKLTAFIEKWNVDIGDKVRKGDVLADLFVPELREDWGTKKATVEFDKERVRLAQKQVEVAAAEVKAARARLEEAQVDPGQVRGRGRALGRPGQAARARSRAATVDRPPDPAGVPESS